MGTIPQVLQRVFKADGFLILQIPTKQVKESNFALGKLAKTRIAKLKPVHAKYYLGLSQREVQLHLNKGIPISQLGASYMGLSQREERKKRRYKWKRIIRCRQVKEMTSDLSSEQLGFKTNSGVAAGRVISFPSLPGLILSERGQVQINQREFLDQIAWYSLLK